MPCYGPDDVHERRFLRSAFCAILTAYTNQHGSLDSLLSSVDWSDAVISRDLVEGWWNDHLKWDRKRRQAEAEY